MRLFCGLRWYLFLIFCILPAFSYKMVFLVFDVSNSQLLFSVRVAEVLADAGHDVTLAMITPLANRDRNFVKIPQSLKVYNVKLSNISAAAWMDDKQDGAVFQELAGKKLIQRLSGQLTLLVESCRATVSNKEFLRWLETEHFDLAFGYMFDVCSVGLVHAAKIPSWVWLNSGSMMDYVADVVGVPIIPSYVPPMMMESAGDMNFVKRVKSLIGHGITKFVWRRFVANPETELFRQIVSPDFPDLVELASKCPLVMANTNDLYELPRPTLAKIVNIGGLGMETRDVKPLPKNIADIMEKGKGTVLMSFGSVVTMSVMPEEWKSIFLETFKRFPDYQFLIKYEKDDLKGRLPGNVHLFKWLPQTDILHHPNTKAFITHGGYNSVQEAILTGVPLVTIPLFGDQFKNARLAEWHGFGVVLPKTELSVDSLHSAIEKVIGDPRYKERVLRLSRMYQKQPISPSDLLVKWSEFAAEFKTLENLEPAGNKLNFFQYHSIDVIAFLGAIFVVILIILRYLLKALLAIISRVVFGAKNKEKTS
ncbi:hypothetical protein Q1695_007551 [Nippostrongylus brasiliensis]|nr:hypothetical protein Q1695_007551 [Nippostrongylus brasiliensis]